jgi:aryl-alcohol dehydrogenase-like predicted oxidoreductase
MLPNMTTYKRVGKSGLHVSPIALGTMQFGWTVDEAASHPILDRYLELGGNFIDTADCYSSWAGNGNPGGISEEILGRWIKARGNRDELVVATKVRAAMGENFGQGRNTHFQREGLSRKWILKACEDSLRRLQVDHIDVYQTHFIDNQVPIEETLSAFTDLIRKGYVRYIGCSNYSAWRLMQSLWAADKKNLEPFISIQPEYNLLSPTRANFERETANVCLEYGIGVIPYSPLAAGFFTGKYRRDQPLPESVRAQGIDQRMSEQNWQVLDTILEIAQRHNTTPTRVTLAWMMAQPFMTAPIVGANTTAQLEDSMGATELNLSSDDVEAISKASDWVRSRTDASK